MTLRENLLAWGRVLLGVFLLSTPSWSQGFALGERQNTRGIGMGRTSAAVSYGLDAAGTNPANLSLGTGYSVMIGIAPTGFQAGGDVLSYEIYTEFFSGVDSPDGTIGRNMTEDDKLRILERFSGEDPGRSYVDLDARLFGIGVRLPGTGVLAFTITDYAGAALTIPRDLARFVLYGNPLGSSYDFGGAEVTANWMRAYTLSFGSTIPGISFMEFLSIGGGVKHVQGFAYYEVLRSESRLSTSRYGVLTGQIDFLARSSQSATLKGSGFDLFPDPSGMGWGFDLGVSAGLTKALSIGASVIDIGSIAWTDNNQEVYTDTLLTIDNPLDPEQQDAIVNAISGIQQRETDTFSTRLPTRFRAGVALQVHHLGAFRHMGGELILAADFVRGFHDAPGSSTEARVSFGAEYKGVPWLPVRAGVWSGGPGGTNVSFGFGVHTEYVAIDLATDNIGWAVAPGRTSYGSLSFGATVRF
ncbi:MAG: DUF5723 family protein [Ignavibacteria bacterium]|nr:DUF5723 family protein [Ignavibacteria bacterium]